MRLIDADALMEKLFEIWHEYKSDTIASDGLSRAIKAIRRATTVHEAPAVDAAPVVHGRWEIRNDGTYGRARAYCTACGKHSGIGGIRSNQLKPYCPNCGAKMDGGEGE